MLVVAPRQPSFASVACCDYNITGIWRNPTRKIVVLSVICLK